MNGLLCYLRSYNIMKEILEWENRQMAITIGVCDDSKEQVELVTHYIHQNSKVDGFHTFSAVDPVMFLLDFREHAPEIVFLDIDMDGMNGIELGQRIREINNETVIVYITGHEGYALDAFGVRAYHYLLKPVSEKKFKAVLDDAISAASLVQLQKVKKGKFTVKSKNSVVSVEFDRISYFEKIGRKVKIQTDTGTIEFYGKFVELIEQLDQTFFVQCHQGFIINKDKIVSYRSKTLCMASCEKVPVSRTYHKAIKGIIENLLFDEGVI